MGGTTGTAFRAGAAVSLLNFIFSSFTFFSRLSSGQALIQKVIPIAWDLELKYFDKECFYISCIFFFTFFLNKKSNKKIKATANAPQRCRACAHEETFCLCSSHFLK